MKIFHLLTTLAAVAMEYLLHITVYRRTALPLVEFYGLDEAVPLDGSMIVYDERAKRRIAYGYRLEDRYLMRLPPAKRLKIIWQEIMLHDKVRPLAMVENNRAYTPFGNYTDGLPAALAAVIRACTPQAQ